MRPSDQPPCSNAADGEATVSGGTGQTSRILIVDDEPFNVDLLEQELEDLGFATISARNGQEALDKVAADPPDLILLDVMMPVLDGLAVCRELKGRDDTRLIPIVIMTALDGVEDRIKGIEAGADDFLTKPVNPRELLARVHTALRLKHTVDRKLGELRRIRDHLAKFVPDAVRRLVLANPDAPELAKREGDVSVLFLDISGYARLSERLPAAALNSLVESYFSAFLDCIHDADGDINETAGDGFMAIFQDADPGNGHDRGQAGRAQAGPRRAHSSGSGPQHQGARRHAENGGLRPARARPEPGRAPEVAAPR